MIVPRHDRLRGPRVLVTEGAVHRVTPARLAAERRRFPALAILPRPIIGVLIGGANGAYRLDLEQLVEIADRIAAAVKRRGGSVVVTPSRRTGADGVRLLRERLAGIPGQVWDGVGENPYFAYLAVADALIVTADSVSMVSEAAATGKPVHIVDLPGGDAKFARFHKRCAMAGITRPFAGKIETGPIGRPTTRLAPVRRCAIWWMRASREGIRRMKQAGFFAGIWLLLGLLFLLVPGIDLAATGLFYVPGEGFPLGDWAPLKAVEDTVPWITKLIVVVVALGAVWLALIGRPLWRLDRKALVFLVAATALGPGLIANTVLKDNWGRARPHQIEAFGGTRQFTPAPLPAAQCERNCAFVSGHAALAFSLVSFALLLPGGRRRRLAVAASAGFGVLVGIGRIAAGGHFLSDVVYAGLIVVATSWLLYEAIVARDLLAGPSVRCAYRAAGAARRLAAELYLSPAGRVAAWAAVAVLVALAAIFWIDRPLALLLHQHAEWHPLAEIIQRLGFGTPYLVAFGIAFVALRWGGMLPRLRPRAGGMREAAMIPAFMLASIAASGLAVDLLKVVFGRTRPKLLFADGIYDFSWLGLAADYWSFPSGHTAAVAALATALWCLWPRHVLFYIALASVVAASQVVTGAHYLSDVVAGGFVAVLVTRAVAIGFTRFRPRLPFGRGTIPQPVLRLP